MLVLQRRLPRAHRVKWQLQNQRLAIKRGRKAQRSCRQGKQLIQARRHRGGGQEKTLYTWGLFGPTTLDYCSPTSSL